MIYLISCKLCKEQHVGPAFKDNFRPRFRVHKSDVITGKDRCGVAKQFLTKCTNGNEVANIEVQLIEQVEEGNYDLDGRLWCREKYWQPQLLFFLSFYYLTQLCSNIHSLDLVCDFYKQALILYNMFL